MKNRNRRANRRARGAAATAGVAVIAEWERHCIPLGHITGLGALHGSVIGKGAFGMVHCCSYQVQTGGVECGSSVFWRAPNPT